MTFAAWIGVFGADPLRGRAYDPAALLDTSPGGGSRCTGGFSVTAVAAWAAGPAAGLLPTGMEWSSGPLAGHLGRAARAGAGGHDRRLRALYAALPLPVAGRAGGRRGDAPLHF
ncbi:hypothetical protein ACF1A9_12100 [Streptomyces sp. NPDC014872]|uniref:hypothetical protein n=1 Tax=unclassified Streptomyces TaxID=2593676 RepID=UPI0036FFFC3A